MKKYKRNLFLLNRINMKMLNYSSLLIFFKLLRRKQKKIKVKKQPKIKIQLKIQLFFSMELMNNTSLALITLISNQQIKNISLSVNLEHLLQELFLIIMQEMLIILEINQNRQKQPYLIKQIKLLHLPCQHCLLNMKEQQQLQLLQWGYLMQSELENKKGQRESLKQRSIKINVEIGLEKYPMTAERELQTHAFVLREDLFLRRIARN